MYRINESSAKKAVQSQLKDRREVHVLNTLNMNDSFRLETQPVNKVLIPKNLLQSSKHKDEINRAYMS